MESTSDAASPRRPSPPNKPRDAPSTAASKGPSRHNNATVASSSPPTAATVTTTTPPPPPASSVSPTSLMADFNSTNDVASQCSKSKQSKSRSGCLTCKKKRIKCGEEKPACRQCLSRGLHCEGYKLSYRFLSFDENTPPPKVMKPTKSKPPASQKPRSKLNQVKTSAQEPQVGHDKDIPWSSALECHQAAQAEDELVDCRETLTEDEFHHEATQCREPSVDMFADMTQPWWYESDIKLLSMPSISPTGSCNSHGEDMSWPDSFPEDVTLFPGGHGAHYGAADFAQLEASCCSKIQHMFLQAESEEMLFSHFDKETCRILSIKDGPGENPWRTLLPPLMEDCEPLRHAVLAMAAFHGSSTQPRLRFAGMCHKTDALRMLSDQMDTMSDNQIIASALALCIGEGWDDKISTGIDHLAGARVVFHNALVRRDQNLKRGQRCREEEDTFRFLANTFVYADSIGRLTSRAHHDRVDFDSIIRSVNNQVDVMVDPLMGCATPLFPLLARVASLVQRVRQTYSDRLSITIIEEANDLREELLNWEPPNVKSLMEPRDPKCEGRHALETAEAYRKAILLHLHLAVTVISSTPSEVQAKDLLNGLASTPVTSGTVMMQIFPLLVGSCEVDNTEYRDWATRRWQAMMERLKTVNVSSAWRVVQEVWRRRDQWRDTQPHHCPSKPTLSSTPGSDASVGSPVDGYFQDHRSHLNGCRASPCSSISTREASDSPPMRRALVRLPRNHTDVSLLSGAMEYSSRGQLHWLSVMSDWNCEVFL